MAELLGNGHKIDAKFFTCLEVAGKGKAEKGLERDAADLASEMPWRCDFGILFQNRHALLSRHQLGAT